MTEREWCMKILKPAWHRPLEQFLAMKVEDKFKSGVPDYDLCLRGIGAKCEAKYSKAVNEPIDDDVLALVSPAQRIALKQWTDARGLAWVIVAHERTKTATLWDAKLLLEQEYNHAIVAQCAYVKSGTNTHIRDLPLIMYKIALKHITA